MFVGLRVYDKLFCSAIVLYDLFFDRIEFCFRSTFFVLFCALNKLIFFLKNLRVGECEF